MKFLVILSSSSNAVGDITSGLTLTEIAESYGVSDPSLYTEFDSADFDTACYNFPDAFTLSGGVVGFDLSNAKDTARVIGKGKYVDLESSATDGYSANQLSSQASLAEIDRLPQIQLVLDALNTLAVQLSDSLSAIASATTINEINNIVNPPTGILQTYRTGTTLEESVYNEFSSASLTQAETELYIPGSTTVIPYDALIPGFPQTPAAFAPADFILQIRETATSRVIKEFECPEVETEISF